MKKIAAVVLLSAVVATPAFAGNEGFYAGLSLGSGKPGIVPAAGVPLNKNSDFIYGGLVGYMFNQNLAAEAQFTGIGKVTDIAGMTAKGDAFSMSAVGFLPLGRRFDLYGKLGVASTSTKVSAGAANRNASRFGLTYGIGAQYNVSRNFGVRFGWDQYGAATANAANVKTNANANVMTIGMVYYF